MLSVIYKPKLTKRPDFYTIRENLTDFFVETRPCGMKYRAVSIARHRSNARS